MAFNEKRFIELAAKHEGSFTMEEVRELIRRAGGTDKDVGRITQNPDELSRVFARVRAAGAGERPGFGEMLRGTAQLQSAGAAGALSQIDAVPAALAGVQPPSEKTQAARQRRQGAEAFAADLGITPIPMPGNFETADQVSSWLDGQGIDITSPSVATFLTNPGVVDLFNDPTSAQAFALSLSVQAPKQAPTAYDQAKQQLGFQHDFPIVQRTGQVSPAEAEVLEARARGGESIPSTPATTSEAVESNRESGAFRFKNGVMVNPESQQVFFPPNENVPGSQAWLANASQNWSPARIRREKENLVRMGWLPESAAKGKKAELFDSVFSQQLGEFHKARYLHMGRPVHGPMTGREEEGAGPRFEPVNFEETRSSVEQDVVRQFEEVFNDQPSDAELRRWTDFVIEQANKLQRGGRGVTPDAALQEAGARFTGRMESTPQAQLEAETEEENTELRDAITAAVLAVRGL